MALALCAWIHILFKKVCLYVESFYSRICYDATRVSHLYEPAPGIMVLIKHRRLSKAQASLRIRAVSPEPLLFAHMKYGSRRRVRPKIRHIAPLDSRACAFEEWVYGRRKVPESHAMIHSFLENQSSKFSIGHFPLSNVYSSSRGWRNCGSFSTSGWLAPGNKRTVGSHLARKED